MPVEPARSLPRLPAGLGLEKIEGLGEPITILSLLIVPDDFHGLRLQFSPLPEPVVYIALGVVHFHIMLESILNYTEEHSCRVQLLPERGV